MVAHRQSVCISAGSGCALQAVHVASLLLRTVRVQQLCTYDVWCCRYLALCWWSRKLQPACTMFGHQLSGCPANCQQAGMYECRCTPHVVN